MQKYEAIRVDMPEDPEIRKCPIKIGNFGVENRLPLRREKSLYTFGTLPLHVGQAQLSSWREGLMDGIELFNNTQSKSGKVREYSKLSVRVGYEVKRIQVKKVKEKASPVIIELLDNEDNRVGVRLFMGVTSMRVEFGQGKDDERQSLQSIVGQYTPEDWESLIEGTMDVLESSRGGRAGEQLTDIVTNLFDGRVINQDQVISTYTRIHRQPLPFSLLRTLEPLIRVHNYKAVHNSKVTQRETRKSRRERGNLDLDQIDKVGRSRKNRGDKRSRLSKK